MYIYLYMYMFMLLLIQVTIGKTHYDFPESSPIIKEAKQQDVPVTYIFIVPSSNYLRLTKKQKLKQSIEVCEWDPCLQGRRDIVSK